jgi:radical SAM superfamily enzyme YgiQ (UPF0313 family)
LRVFLVDLSAKHIHKSPALWCIKAYCGQHVPFADISVGEYTVNDPVNSVLDGIYTARPDVIGFSCYIWNIELVIKLARAVKSLLPGCVIVFGGPEVSYGNSSYPCADHVIKGAGEAAFADYLHGIAGRPAPERRCPEELPSPLTQDYFDSFAAGKMLSIKNQLVYYESSRGCPFSCSYCLSSATSGVRYLPLERVLSEIDLLSEKGAGIVKFTDRTFNADQKRAAAVLRHILTLKTNCAWHFEADAALFDRELLSLISSMPPGRVQFEIGIQSLNPETLRAVCRETDIDAALENIRKLISYGNTHIHLDLIAGLPHETLSSFKEGVDRCLSLRPHMLQLGVLKMLKGTRIREESGKYGYVYSQDPPYQVFSNNTLSYGDIMEIRRIAQVIDRFYNKGILAGYAADGIYTNGSEFFSRLALSFGPGGYRNMSAKNAHEFIKTFLT